MSSMNQALKVMRDPLVARPIGARVRHSRFSPLIAPALAVAFLLLTPCLVNGQKKYGPDHPDVKAMCDKAVKVLSKKGSSNAGDREAGAVALRGLAILQYHKRYFQRVPRDEPYLKFAVEDVAKHFPGILEEEEMYYPCLALILLAEYDSSKYQSQVKAILKMIERRQLKFGAHSYKRERNSGDTSQTQFVALALTVAKTHGFDFDVNIARRSLEWFVRSQKPDGSWVYKPKFNENPNGEGGGKKNLSMQAAGLGSVYLLSDLLQLFKRVKPANKGSAGSEGLPGSVRIYTKPIANSESAFNKRGPLVDFDRGRLIQSTKRGNDLLIQMFSPKYELWQYYYLYALERYAYFREQADGDVSGIDDWYDRSIEFLKKAQNENGVFPRKGHQFQSNQTCTAFAVLFMVRSSEVINLPAAEAELDGDLGFKSDVVLKQGADGRVQGLEAERNLAETLELMKAGATDQQLREVAESLKRQIGEFRKKDDKSRGEIKAFLRSMIGANNYFRRLIAVRFLAGEQDMDNVPALIYALGDPDFRIAIEAHNGLRLVSRKIDSLSVSQTTRTNALRSPGVLTADEKNLMTSEFSSVKGKWTNWFVKIRPGAELLD